MIGSNDLAKKGHRAPRAHGQAGFILTRRDELFAHGLPRGAALDDELRAATFAALDELGVVRVQDAARLPSALRWFEAPLPTAILAERVAQLLRESAEELRELGARDDLSGVEERAALAEPLFTAPPAPSAGEPPAPAQMRNAYATSSRASDAASLSASSSTRLCPAASRPRPPRRRRRSLSARSRWRWAPDPYEHRTCLERCDARSCASSSRCPRRGGGRGARRQNRRGDSPSGQRAPRDGARGAARRWIRKRAEAVLKRMGES